VAPFEQTLQGRCVDKTCDAVIEVKGKLREILETIEGPHELEPQWGCELPQGHLSSHHALGQGANDPGSGKEWWIRWTVGTEPEVVELINCESQFNEEVWLLFGGHEGPHKSGSRTWS
jgi:hypothetical protein